MDWGRNSVLGFAGFRKDSTCVAKATPAEQVALRLPSPSADYDRTCAAGCFTFGMDKAFACDIMRAIFQ